MTKIHNKWLNNGASIAAILSLIYMFYSGSKAKNNYLSDLLQKSDALFLSIIFLFTINLILHIKEIGNDMLFQIILVSLGVLYFLIIFESQTIYIFLKYQLISKSYKQIEQKLFSKREYRHNFTLISYAFLVIGITTFGTVIICIYILELFSTPKGISFIFLGVLFTVFAFIKFIQLDRLIKERPTICQIVLNEAGEKEFLKSKLIGRLVRSMGTFFLLRGAAW